MEMLESRDFAASGARRANGASHEAADALSTLGGRARKVADVAAAHAASVDRDAAFPRGAIDAARAHRLLGTMVPGDLGGDNATVADVADICFVLARACASTAMIFAMHQIMVACLARHARASVWHAGLLRRLAAEQLLLASSTTDGQGGGDLRSSSAAIERTGSRIALVKNATVVSYGAEADAIVTTARRAPDAQPSDQILTAFVRDDYGLERRLEWDALGMRGTCSAGFVLKATGNIDQILPEPYSAIHARTMMPVANLTWSAVWTGIAAAAVDRARAFVRNAARKGGGQMPPGAAHLTRAAAALRMQRGMLAAALQRYQDIAADPELLDGMEAQTAMNLLKVNASEGAVAIVMSAMRASGLAGYRNDGEFSLSRHLRDVLSAPIMINNDRILANAEAASLLIPVPASLRD